MSVTTSAITISDAAKNASQQAIGFLMQQGVENPGCISLAAGFVDETSLPVDAARTALSELLTADASGRKALQYGTTQGPLQLRKVFRSFLADLDDGCRHVADLPLEQIFLTTGSQQFLLLTAQAVLNPGDICLVAAPTYFVFLGVLDGVGARAVPVESDENGMQPEALARQLKQLADDGQLHRVKMVYVVSYYDNPAGISVSTDRRPELLRIVREWSVENRILLLEDAAYRELYYDAQPLPSILSFDDDREHVVLTQTFSKSFSPGIRVGLGVVPRELVKPIADLKGNADFGSAHLNQQLMAHVIRSAAYGDHLQHVRNACRIKRDCMLNAAETHFGDLPGVSWLRPDGGLYIWMSLPTTIPTGFDSPLFRTATQIHKVMYVPGEIFYPSTWKERPTHQMRLSFGVESADGISDGMRRLAAAVRDVLVDG